jgi:hyperosmotically inducible periplasmic protein
MADSRSSRSRIVVETEKRHQRRSPQIYARPQNAEIWVAISVIIAGALATFLALYITSRPFDPATASLAPQQTVPAGAVVTPSAKPSPSPSPTPQIKPSPVATPSAAGGEISNPPVDDTSIQAHIDAALAADPLVSKLDVSTLVENGKVTVVGSVSSPEIKQRVERIIRSIKGVATVENQLVVNEATP